MYNYLTSAFPLPVCGMLRFAVRFQRNTQYIARSTKDEYAIT